MQQRPENPNYCIHRHPVLNVTTSTLKTIPSIREHTPEIPTTVQHCHLHYPCHNLCDDEDDHLHHNHVSDDNHR
ncbi:unnamed protein product [Schistocephalus solidus]|uniref:Uncharacterized protein n=1 Tax=Schistocephalus solidus TaxID=70667 RepID=A0A183T5J7_SCHSO|nr:unnamed protein product [Schistocephalus solidus]